MEEKRICIRSRSLKPAMITFGGGGISCVVRNRSEAGAQLEVETPVGIPDRFFLMIGNESAARRCRLVWRKEKRIGVAFY